MPSVDSSVLVQWSNPASDLALVCIPWAGAGAAPFRDWVEILGTRVALFGVRLAGRETRVGERFADSLEAVVDELVEGIQKLNHSRIALFGHCSGAILALETAYAIRDRAHAKSLDHMFVASQEAPAALLQTGRITHVRPPVFDAAIDADPDLRAFFLEIVEADARLLGELTCGERSPLDVPIIVFRGKDDKEISRAQAETWRDETVHTVEVVEIVGDHFLQGDAWPLVAAGIGMRLGRDA